MCIKLHVHVSIYIVSGTDNTHSNKVRTMILTVSSIAFCFVKKRLAHNQSRSVSKTSVNASLHGFSGIGNHMYT